MRLTHLRAWLGVTILALSIGGIAWSFAPDPATSGAHLHPAESVFYFALDGGSAHEAAFKKTAAYAALYESGLMDSLIKAAGRLKNLTDQIPEKDRQSMGRMIEFVKHAMDRGVSFSVVMEPLGKDVPTVSMTAIVNGAAPYRDVLEEFWRAGFANEPGARIEPFNDAGKPIGLIAIIDKFADSPGGASFIVCEKGGHLVFNLSTLTGGRSGARDVTFSAINGAGKNVSTHRLYQNGVGQRTFDQNGFGWFDFKLIKETYGKTPLPPTRTGQQATINDLFTDLGLDTLEAVVFRTGYKDRASWGEVSVIAPGPRTGLMALLDQPTFALADLPPLPPRPISIYASGFDAAAAFDQLVGIFKKISARVEPQAIDVFDQQLAQAENQMGALTKTNVATYLHPSVPKGDPGGTNFVGVAGVGEAGPTLDARNKKAGAFAYDKGRSIRDFTDGTSNTFIVGESKQAAPWAQGGPGTIRPLTTTPYINGPDGFGGISIGGAHFLNADGSVRFVSDKVDPKVMEARSTIAGGEVVNDF